MPHIYKRKDSPYYWIGFSKKERMLGLASRSTKSKNRKVAEAELEKAVKEVKQKSFDSHYQSAPVSELTIHDAFRLYQQDKRSEGKPLSDKTIDNYNRAIRYFTMLPVKPVDQYGRKDYLNFVEIMKDTSQNTQAIYTRCIYALFNWMHKEGMIDKNPMKRVREIGIEKNFPTDEEIKSLLDYLKTETKFYQLCQFQILTAFRIHEVLKFRKSDIKKNTIRVLGKGNKLESIPIMEDTREFLKVMDLPEDDSLVFPFSEDSIYRLWQRVNTTLKLNMHSHDLRRYRLSSLANAGVDILTLRDYARHSDIKTTLKYYVDINKQKMLPSLNKVYFTHDLKSKTG